MGMTIDELQKYINALRKCAKEHDNDTTYTGHIIVSDLCRDTANLLETVEAIPKADYENRLKADMVAMLTDMLIDVEEIESREQWCDYANDNCISRYDVEDLFQQKINSLKEGTDG